MNVKNTIYFIEPLLIVVVLLQYFPLVVFLLWLFQYLHFQILLQVEEKCSTSQNDSKAASMEMEKVKVMFFFLCVFVYYAYV